MKVGTNAALILAVLLSSLTVACKRAAEDKKSESVSVTRKPRGSARSRLETSETFKRLRDKGRWLEKGVPLKADSGELIAFLGQVNSQEWDIDGDYGGYLRSLFFHCKPEDFEKAMEIFGKTKGSENSKSLFLNSLVSRMIESERPESLSVAIETITRTVGDGSTGRQAVQFAFAKAGFSAVAIDELRKLEDSGQKKELLARLTSSLEWRDDLASLANLPIEALKDDEKSALYWALALRTKNAGALGISAESLLNESVSFAKSDKDLDLLLLRCAKTNPAVTWELLVSRVTRDVADGSHPAIAESFQGMVKRDGANALKRLDTLQDQNLKARLLKDGVSELLKNNPVEAKAWYEEAKSKLTPLETDSVQSALAKSAVNKGSTEDAKVAAELIADPMIKSKIIDQIVDAERGEIKGRAEKDPLGTLLSVVSEQSNYDNSVVGTAMRVWLSKDPNAASSWVNSNWSSIPSDKAQHLAAACADIALKGGDTKTAKLWLDQVSDPVLKGSLQRKINGRK